jgi:hypothetical protein
VHVARAELRLAHSDVRPLRHVPLRPDPLTPFAAAVRDLRRDLDEQVDVCLDLLPVLPRDVAARTRKLVAQAGGTGGFAASSPAWWRELGGSPLEMGRSAGGKQRRSGEGDVKVRRAAERFGAGEQPVFAVQLLIRTQSTVPGRAKTHLARALAAFDQWSEQNHWRVAGVNLGGAGHLGADLPLLRAWFDHRIATGRFAPVRSMWLTGEELAGLLKPPTAACHADNVARSGGMVPLPPQGLPTWRPGSPGLFYAGIIDTAEGERHVGVPLEDTFFTIHFGRSRWGKTELMLARALGLALANTPPAKRTGLLLLDPHRDGIQRMKAMLTAPEHASRVLELDLTRGSDGYDAKSAGWNPLSMQDASREDIDEKVASVVDAVAATLGWGDQAPRAKTLLTVAAETLCHLALAVPAEIAPTVFQIPTLLTNAEWREQILPVLPPSLQDYWSERFPRVPAEATTVVTNLFDRLSSNKKIVALLGSSRSTFSMRRAMDEAAIVLVCPGDDEDKSKLMSCLIVFELLRAAKSRQAIPRDERRRFDAFLDELAALDGAARGNIAAILEQTAKFGLRMHGANQLPSRLSKTSRAAFLSNASHVFTTALAYDDARSIAHEWGAGRLVTPETITEIDRYAHIGHLSIGGRRTKPFRLRGPEVTTLYAEHHNPAGVETVDEAIDATMARRSVWQVLADLEALEGRIVEHLTNRRTRPAPAAREADSGPVPAGALHSSGDHAATDVHRDVDDEVDLTPRTVARTPPADGGAVVDLGAARGRRRGNRS